MNTIRQIIPLLILGLTINAGIWAAPRTQIVVAGVHPPLLSK